MKTGMIDQSAGLLRGTKPTLGRSRNLRESTISKTKKKLESNRGDTTSAEKHSAWKNFRLTRQKGMKYWLLLAALQKLSDPCDTDIELFDQWEYMNKVIDYETNCHCGTRIIDNIYIRNKITRQETKVGSVCQKYFDNEEMANIIKIRKYERTERTKAKLCKYCGTMIRINSVKDYCKKHECECKGADEEWELKQRKKAQEHLDKFKSKTMRFGKHKGKRMRDIPRDYLRWLASTDWYSDKNIVLEMLDQPK